LRQSIVVPRPKVVREKGSKTQAENRKNKYLVRVQKLVYRLSPPSSL
jgi:hypothetical protein